MRIQDWDAFEASLRARYLEGLDALAAAHPGEMFYAVALFGVYRELDGPLTLPLLAAGRERDAPEWTGTFWSDHFCPAAWPLAELELPGSVSHETDPLERALFAEANASDPAHWRSVAARFDEALVGLAAALRDHAKRVLTVTDDFVAYIFDESGGPAMAARTIDPERFARLFPLEVEGERALAAVREMPPPARAAFLVSRLGQHDGAVSSEDAQRELRAMGADALDALSALLTDPTAGWMAAMSLAEIGESRPDVIERLRARAEERWFATALGALGDLEWLLEQEEDVALLGIIAPLRRAHEILRPLDYRPLEAWLTAGTDERRARVEKELGPGSGGARIAPSDVEEALRGSTSEHAVVRWHACSALSWREVAASKADRVLPALAARLEDPHPLVRRVAVVGLEMWKGQAAPYHAAIAKLRDDPDEIVRYIAEGVTGSKA